MNTRAIEKRLRAVAMAVTAAVTQASTRVPAVRPWPMRELVILAGLAAAVAVSQALHARRLRSLRRRLEARLDELGAHVFQAKTSASAAVYELQQLNAAAQRLRSRARSSDAPPRREVAEGLLQRVELLSTKLGAIEGTNQRLLLEAREAAAILAKIDERTSDPGEGED